MPKLKRNLISLRTLEGKGYSFKSENGKIEVSKRSFTYLEGIRNNGLYFLLGSTFIGSASSVEGLSNDCARTWHLRLGHVSEKGMSELVLAEVSIELRVLWSTFIPICGNLQGLHLMEVTCTLCL